MPYFILFLLYFLPLSACKGQSPVSTDSMKSLEEEGKCTPFYKWPHRYNNCCFYADGRKMSVSRCNFFHVLHGKAWDEEGRLTGRTRQYPFGSTSYILVSRDRTYDTRGHLIKYTYSKEDVQCFGGGIIKQKTIEYDERGKVKSRIVKHRRDFRKGVKALF